MIEYEQIQVNVSKKIVEYIISNLKFRHSKWIMSNYSVKQRINDKYLLKEKRKKRKR